MSAEPSWAVIWDVDGTLVDTAEQHFLAWCALAKELDKPFTRADFAGTFGWRNPEIIPRLFGTHYSPDEVAALGNRKEDIYRDMARHGVQLLPGAEALLDAVRAAGGRQAVGSSAPRGNLELILANTGTAGYFDAVVAMEDTVRGKPDPEVFVTAARKLGVPPARCLVLEDAPVGVQAAKAGGMHAIGITFVGHHPADALAAAGADRIVTSLVDVSATDVRRLLLNTER